MTTRQPVTVLFDFSNLAYTCFFRALTALQIKPEDARDPFDAHVGTFANKIQSCLEGVYWSEALYVMEGRSHKHDIFPDYKAKRKTKQLQVDPKLPLYHLLSSWRSEILWHPNEEADDVISSYVAQNHDKSFMIFSTDKDLWQLLDHDNVVIYDPTRNERITLDHVKEAFGLQEPHKIKLHKTLWGDTSDNIPNLVPRMQGQIIPIIEACDGTLDNLLESIATSGVSKRCMELVERARPDLDRNHKLVSLAYKAKVNKISATDWLRQELERLEKASRHA